MSRLSFFRRAPKVQARVQVEALEKREVLTAGGPSAEAQYMLQLINMARTNPPAAAQWVQNHVNANIEATLSAYNVNLNSVLSIIANSPARPPLAWNDSLAASATQQSNDEISMGVQTHTGANGSTIGGRLAAIGFPTNGENSYAYSQSVDHAMEAYLIDWGVSDSGHRRNIMQPTASPDQFFTEAGIGIVATNNGQLGPYVNTVDFGRPASGNAFLLGVAYNDQNGSGTYSQGEGQGNVEIDATNVATGQASSTLTWDNGGGYEIQLAPGTYNVKAVVGNQVVKSQQVSISNQNIEIDYNLSLPWQGGTASSASISSRSVSAAQTIAQQAPMAVVAPVVPPAPTYNPAGWSNWGSTWTANRASS
jgi:uncharacterized protein YkwD